MTNLRFLVVAVLCQVVVEMNAVPLLPYRRMGVRSYPQRTMMFTGFYRPVSRSEDRNQGTNIYGQESSVGSAYLGGMEPVYWQPGLSKDRPVSSAEAEATPDFEGNPGEDGAGDFDDVEKNHTENPPHADTTERTYSESPKSITTKRKTDSKKKEIPKPIPQDEDEDDEEDEYDDVPAYLVPRKGNKKNRGFLPFNNYFPMVFSFPGVPSRSGSSESIPGIVTAVANSYSTSKGGIASSIATAYGGTPNRKKRPPTDDQ